MREHGYHVFEHRLPAGLRAGLLKFALEEKAVVTIEKQPQLDTYDRRNPRGEVVQ